MLLEKLKNLIVTLTIIFGLACLCRALALYKILDIDIWINVAKFDDIMCIHGVFAGDPFLFSVKALVVFIVFTASVVLSAKVVVPRLLDDSSPRRELTKTQYRTLVGVLVVLAVLATGSFLLDGFMVDKIKSTKVGILLIFAVFFLAMIGLGNWLKRPDTMNPKKLNPEKFE